MPELDSHSCTDYRLLPDLKQTVPVLTGHETDCVAENWLCSVDALATINNWPLLYHLQYVKSNLSTAAHSWYLTETFTDWADFLVKFRAAFVRTLRLTDRWRALSERLQGDNENIADYYYDKLWLSQALKLSFVETRDHIIMGIRSHDLAMFVMGRPHGSPAALLADLQEWERLSELRRAQFPSASRTVTAVRVSRSEQQPIDSRNNSFKPTSLPAEPKK